MRFYHCLVCLSLLAILSACGSGQGDSVDDTITDAIPTDHGSVSGFQDRQTMVYLGIPFAAPPVGPLRWQPPTEPKVWQGTRQATAFSPPCPQVDGNSAVIGNEDCLYLNVWKPLAASAGANGDQNGSSRGRPSATANRTRSTPSGVTARSRRRRASGSSACRAASSASRWGVRR